MIVAFRCDASREMGTGHVMRCLTLAQALSLRGAQCHFICRAHPGHLIEFIANKGFQVHTLPMVNDMVPQSSSAPRAEQAPAHAAWLGTTQMQDVSACQVILQNLAPLEWLIVDHYALDSHWEAALRPACKKLMVIDDLADRAHDCDVLLDQTLGRAAHEYDGLTPPSCTRLCGSGFALLRPEFQTLRDISLQMRRPGRAPRQLLITLGGVDKDNLTTLILVQLRNCPLPPDCVVTVVMGASAPWINEVRDAVAHMPWRTDLVVNAGNMAELMAESDVAIGAAGSTSWERCCLGLPTIMLIQADNQKRIAHELVKAGAAVIIDRHELTHQHGMSTLASILGNTRKLSSMSVAASHLVDGMGATRVVSILVPSHPADQSS